MEKTNANRQDAKAPRKETEIVFAVLLGIASGDTRGKTKLGALGILAVIFFF
jgi:hypothetical protein